MMGRQWRRDRRSERGAAAVEFAFIAPFLIFLLFGIIGVGFMLSFRQAVSQAAAEGARAAAVAPGGLPVTAAGSADSKQKRAREAINQSLASYGVTCSSSGTLVRNNAPAGKCTITESPTCSGSTTAAKCMKVALDYEYKDHSLLPSVPGLGLVLPAHMKYSIEVEIS